ncbi:MAG TPA: hypothetical protein VH061_01085 [Solirubrobacteraceae bacterium]|nr:hypothetical protein [Solirubrobacteraceae bacterium]
MAAVRPGDASATHAYLLAKLRLQREGTGSGEAGLDAVRGLAEQLHTECPGILTGTPLAGPEEAPDRVDSELSKEIADDALNADETLNRLPDTRFYATVKRLRWSNRKLTRLLHDLALESVRLSEIPAPDICADIRYWVASGYSGLSAGTIRVVHEDDVANSTATIEVEPKEKEGLFDSEEVVRHRLRRYENRSDRRLDVRAFPFKKLIGNPKFEAALATYFRAVEQVFSSLGKSGLELPIS